jgi:hypothetical protein
MFWFGFISIYLILLILIGVMKLSNKLISSILEGARRVVCALLFTLFVFLFTLLYSIVAIVTGNVVVNALLCAIFLVFSWFIEEKLYRLLSGENGSEKDKVLTKEDKNLCALFALIGVILSSIVLFCEDRNSEYFILVSMAVSVWIGTYVPVSEVYKGTSIKKIVCIIKKEFKNQKVSVLFSAIASTTIVTFLVSKNEVILKVNELVNKFGSGIACGSIVLIVILIIVALCKKNK